MQTAKMSCIKAFFPGLLWVQTHLLWAVTKKKLVTASKSQTAGFCFLFLLKTDGSHLYTLFAHKGKSLLTQWLFLSLKSNMLGNLSRPYSSGLHKIQNANILSFFSLSRLQPSRGEELHPQPWIQLQIHDTHTQPRHGCEYCHTALPHDTDDTDAETLQWSSISNNNDCSHQVARIVSTGTSDG